MGTEEFTQPFDQRPIAIFDSGIGGLSILREIRDRLSQEDLLYFADQVHVPYGQRSLTEVRDFSVSIVKYLLHLNAKIIVVACNTASAAALHHLRAIFTESHFVGMEPAVKPAAAITKTKLVGVLATPATFQGELYASVVERFAEGVEVIEVVLPGLVEQIEAGDLSGVSTRRLLEQPLENLRKSKVDTVVLACTHYPFVIPIIEELLGPEIRVLDPSPAIARQTERVLINHGLQSKAIREGRIALHSSLDGRKLQEAVEQLVGLQGEYKTASWDPQGEIQMTT